MPTPQFTIRTPDQFEPPMSLASCRPWLTELRPETVQTKVRLICAPFAGGASTHFRAWREFLPAEIALYCLELPGRCNRFNEPYVESMKELMEQLERVVCPALDEPFALFGHSLGATVMFEFARLMERPGHRRPTRLILSGQRAFHRPSPRPPIHHLPDEQFMSEVHRYGGIPHGLFEVEELRDMFLPLLRADFTMGETYEYQEGPPLRTSLTVYGGLEDEEVSSADLNAWKRYTSGEFNCRLFPGNHFFLHQHEALFIQSLLADLGV